jgi:guanylate kinase
LFDIDWQGTEQLANSSRDDLVSIFILPPSMAELERRLRSRNSDSEEVIKGRMEKAADEISHWNAYDYVIINNDVNDSLARIHHILNAERCRRIRQHGLKGFLKERLGL